MDCAGERAVLPAVLTRRAGGATAVPAAGVRYGAD